MRKLFILFLLAAATTAAAQTVTPFLALSTPDSVAKMATYTVTLQVGAAGTVTQVVPTCTTAGTGATCTITPLPGFNPAVPTLFTVTLIDPATGLSKTGTLNYTPGQPPASFTLTNGWKISVP